MKTPMKTALAAALILFSLPLHAITEAQKDRAATLAVKFPGAYVGIVEPTGSMKPLFDAGDLLVIVPRDFDSIKPGDVIAFTGRGGALAAHRAIRKNLGAWITKGDNCAFEDREPVSPRDFSGVVVAIVR
jgi:signal peptidase I